MTKRNNKRKRNRRRRRKQRPLAIYNENKNQEESVSIYDHAKMWYNSRKLEEKAPMKDMAVFIRDFFKKHEAKFVPHQIQLTDSETKEFDALHAAAMYGECDLQDMARVMKKYERPRPGQRKLLIDLGSGRGQITALFFFSDLDTDVVACELSVQRFESACRLLTLLADEFRFFHILNENNEFVIINPHGAMLNLQRKNLFALPQTVFKDADLVLMDVHLPSEVPDRDLVHIFRCLPATTPLIAYNRNRRIWPSPPFVLSAFPEYIRTDWNPDGYPFQVYHYHHRTT